MDTVTKASIIIGIAIVVATAMYTYFTPYHSCIRNFNEVPGGWKAETWCYQFGGTR